MRRAGGASTMSEVTSTAPIGPRRVVIVGGGVAGLEAALALHDLAETEMSVTVIAPETMFMPRALDLARPVADGHTAELDLAHFMTAHGGRFRRTAVLSVDAEQRTLSCTTGPGEPSTCWSLPLVRRPGRRTNTPSPSAPTSRRATDWWPTSRTELPTASRSSSPPAAHGRCRCTSWR